MFGLVVMFFFVVYVIISLFVYFRMQDKIKYLEIVKKLLKQGIEQEAEEKVKERGRAFSIEEIEDGIYEVISVEGIILYLYNGDIDKYFLVFSESYPQFLTCTRGYTLAKKGEDIKVVPPQE